MIRTDLGKTVLTEIQNNIAKEYAFAVYLDKDKYLGKLLELKGLRLFNRAAAVELCDDKMITYLHFLLLKKMKHFMYKFYQLGDQMLQ